MSRGVGGAFLAGPAPIGLATRSTARQADAGTRLAGRMRGCGAAERRVLHGIGRGLVDEALTRDPAGIASLAPDRA